MNQYIDQITLECLLNKELMESHVMKQREKQIHYEDFCTYKPRIATLFEQLMGNQKPDDLPPDVKYAYDTFVQSAIHSFKIADNVEKMQEEYKYIDMAVEDLADVEEVAYEDADKLIMRSVKMEVHLPTLDKYVKKTTQKKEKPPLILPKRRVREEEEEANAEKKNIDYMYENQTESEEDPEILSD